MLQDIAPHVYRNEMSFRAPGPDDYVLAFSGKDTIYGMKTDGGFRLPRLRELKKRPQSLQYLFSVDEEAYDLWEDEAIPEADGFAFVKTGDLRTLPPAETRFACAVSESLRRWYGGTRFCGRCGAKMEKSKIERAMVCPVCGNTVYPKICPGVIAAVCDGERIVLTRYKNRPFKNTPSSRASPRSASPARTPSGARCWRRRACMSKICAFTSRSPGSTPTRC
jgi:NAD+ diphosphatase